MEDIKKDIVENCRCKMNILSGAESIISFQSAPKKKVLSHPFFCLGPNTSRIKFAVKVSNISGNTQFFDSFLHSPQVFSRDVQNRKLGERLEQNKTSL